MSSKETKPKRQKALEAPREPPRPKTHWDHVLEEMAWLSKDFEAERKWKLSQAKKVALRASKGMLDQATRGERRIKEEEQRLRKVAVNISKDVKKFWLKIEKLVLYKHQLELEAKKQKARDKQLEFLLGQTERYSNMLAENLVNTNKPAQICTPQAHGSFPGEEKNDTSLKETRCLNNEHLADKLDNDEDFNILSEDDSEDDEHTLEEDEALITEKERQEELEALQDEMELPLDELLKRYVVEEGKLGSSPTNSGNGVEPIELEENYLNGREDHPCSSSRVDPGSSPSFSGRRSGERDGVIPAVENYISDVEMSEAANMSEYSGDPDGDELSYDFSGDEQEDGEYFLGNGEEKDDEATMEEEEELAKNDSSGPVNEIAMLQKESEIPIEELLAQYRNDFPKEYSEDESEYVSASSGDMVGSPPSGTVGVNKQVDAIEEAVRLTEHEPAVNLDTEGQEALLLDKPDEIREGEDRIADAAAAARSAQPTGITFSTTKVQTKFPFLLKYPLREYQHIGLDWLVTMYEKRLNGILADEMGLGKTIMTISLLAHLACEKGIWGPHLIVVPTSVMLNWETEFLKWCPAFKILTYFGTAKERKLKRQGWLKPNFFHVCITTYRLVIQDSKVFKRKKWKYLILDEAHLIKNWKSQRWQTLLNFNSKRRILLTGTPLQNDLMELWSLMHFLMPHIFQSHQEFKDWFCNPIAEMVEGQEKVNKEVIDRLHNVLRPFLLRRLKRDVEKQLPMKREHVVYCRLSKRQRNLYEDFISSSETQATLASTNFFGMIGVIMQLRKVCNHPDLFEGRPIISSYDMHGIDVQLSSSICSVLSPGPFSTVDLRGLGYIFTHLDLSMCSWESAEVEALATPSCVIMERPGLDVLKVGQRSKQHNMRGTSIFEEIRKAVMEERFKEAKQHAASMAWLNSLRCRKKPIYPTTLRELVSIRHPVDDIIRQKTDGISYSYSSNLAEIVLTPVERFQRMIEVIESFMFVIPPARAPLPVCWCSKSGTSVFLPLTYKEKCTEVLLPLLSPVRPAIIRRQVYFPDRRLIQFDCGKLQELAMLLRKLKSQGHRALIFTQMTKMLDILEAFINLYGYTYMRLDGSTQPEERQTLMQRFNTNPKIFLFILSTRSGGVGINLVGADTVIFYDSDWNPAMDQQAQDRCHRIGQTREVHIYRLISEKTIEENILKKANQKRALDDLVIQSGSYNTEFFKKLDPMELFSDHQVLTVKNMQKGKKLNTGSEVFVSNDDVEAALKQAEDEADYMALKKVEEEEAVDNQEFTEEASGKLEDDDLANEDDIKGDEPSDQGGWISNPNKNGGQTLDATNHKAERSLTLAGKDDDVDLLADVKQMAAAAAAAGQEILFENQLRPLDRYAMRFLELWDPIIDKAAIHSEVKFEEKEWELERIEKYKEEMEAEMDEDEEPLVYERWDADFATEAYRQQVEVLAQHQLMEDLEYEAKLKEAAADDNNSQGNTMQSNRKPKSKSKKKAKKTKFKSLKKRTLASKAMPVKEEPSLETMSSADDLTSIEGSDFDVESTLTAASRKRKKTESSRDLEEVKHLKKKSKKTKKDSSEMYCQEKVYDLSGGQHDEALEIRSSETIDVDIEAKTPSRSKAGGKISIIPMPIKRILMIKPEKTKKGNMLSRDCVPSPDSWVSQEDAVLCAAVHEYGPNWSLVSDILHGITAGSFYRGRYRHPVHCCERFRELVQKYILYPAENLNNEKASTSGKALLKVTEDHIQTLLDFSSEMADDELLLQNHFTALISSAWRASAHTKRRHNIASLPNGFCSKERNSARTEHMSRNTSRESTGKKLTNFGNGSELVGAALCNLSSKHQSGNISASNLEEEMSPIVETMGISLEFQRYEGDTIDTFPSFLNLTILGSDPTSPVSRPAAAENHLNSISSMAEHRSRESARTCTKDSGRWASSAFPINDINACSSSKLQTLYKHKLSSSDLIKPSKSKSRRTSTMEHCGSFPPVSEPMHQLNHFVLARDQHLELDPPTVAPPAFPYAEACDTEDNTYGDVFLNLPLETETSDLVPHNYMPDFISGLDDCSYLPDYIDFG